jgi:hypothetical protein
MMLGPKADLIMLLRDMQKEFAKLNELSNPTEAQKQRKAELEAEYPRWYAKYCALSGELLRS